MAGRRVGRLHVIRRHGVHATRRQIIWRCHCSCGAVALVCSNNLRGPRVTQSCGCLHREAARLVGARSATHHEAGVSRTTEYVIWMGMRERCNNPKDHAYPSYGGRGIKVCRRWDTFTHFLVDMGRRPSRLHSLDRKDNDKGYTPSNCRWATKREQAENRRSARLISYDGVTRTLGGWARAVGIGGAALADRLRRGWPLSSALTRRGNQGRGWMATTCRRTRVRCTTCHRTVKSTLRGFPSRHAPPEQLHTGNGLRITCSGVQRPGVST